jgi:hypothetical protein
MTSYTVSAESMQDAIDKASRRAQDDGLVVRGVGRVFRGVIPGTWTVYLRVEVRR